SVESAGTPSDPPAVLRCASAQSLANPFRLAFRRVRISPMAIAARDPSIAVVDSELRTLVTTHAPGLVYGFALGVVVAARPLASTPLHVPASLRAGHHVVSFRTFSRLHHCLQRLFGCGFGTMMDFGF